MRYANDIKGKKIEVSFSGEKAICRDCGLEVYGRKGRVRVAYWKHTNDSDCDKWYEPITRWHIDWQNKFPKDYQEKRLFDKETEEIHRADIQLPSGFVIEVQNSPIKIDEIEQREKFYGKNGLVWILNGKNLASKSVISHSFEKQIFAISSEIPSYISEFPDYNMDTINKKFWGSTQIQEIRKYDKIKKIENQNGNFYWFEFKESIEFDNLVKTIKSIIKQILIDLYGYDKCNELIDYFETKVHHIRQDRFFNIELKKLYWRKFIDFMKYPVFIDNIVGVPETHIFWYQKKEIVNKQDFVKKIVTYKNQ